MSHKFDSLRPGLKEFYKGWSIRLLSEHDSFHGITRDLSPLVDDRAVSLYEIDMVTEFDMLENDVIDTFNRYVSHIRRNHSDFRHLVTGDILPDGIIIESWMIEDGPFSHQGDNRKNHLWWWRARLTDFTSKQHAIETWQEVFFFLFLTANGKA